MRPSYDGRRVTARRGVAIDKAGHIDLTPWLALADGAKSNNNGAKSDNGAAAAAAQGNGAKKEQ